jgi:hypothetical protein
MSSFFRSKLARELAVILRQRWGGRPPFPVLDAEEHEPIRDDLEYFTDRHSKQMKLAASASTPAAREAHLEMARQYRAKASEALRTAMRHNRDALHLSLLELPTERNAALDALIETDSDPVRRHYVERS